MHAVRPCSLLLPQGRSTAVRRREAEDHVVRVRERAAAGAEQGGDLDKGEVVTNVNAGWFDRSIRRRYNALSGISCAA